MNSERWLIDIRLRGEWRPSSTTGFERTAELARQRCDAVHHWCTSRVTSNATGEAWVREPGRGWQRVDAAPASAPAPARAAAALPVRAAGIPDDQLQWWQR